MRLYWRRGPESNRARRICKRGPTTLGHRAATLCAGLIAGRAQTAARCPSLPAQSVLSVVSGGSVTRVKHCMESALTKGTTQLVGCCLDGGVQLTIQHSCLKHLKHRYQFLFSAHFHSPLALGQLQQLGAVAH